MTTNQSEAVRATFKGHQKPESGVYYGDNAVQASTGVQITFRVDPVSKGKLYIYNLDGVRLAWIGLSSKFWFAAS